MAKNSLFEECDLEAISVGLLTLRHTEGNVIRIEDCAMWLLIKKSCDVPEQDSAIGT